MEKIRIGDVCEILNGYAFKSENYVNSGIRIIRIANVQKGYIEDNSPVFYPIDSKGLDKYMLEENDLLLSLTGNVGRVATLEKELLPAALNQRVACLRLKTNRISKGYLFHILNSDYFEDQCINSSKGIAQKNMSTEWLKEYEIPIYSNDEQNKIVLLLDKIRSIIADRKKQIQFLDDLVKARFVEMFGTPLLNEYNWNEVYTADICNVTDGSHFSPKGVVSGFPMLSVKDMRNDGFHYSNCKRISKADYDNLVKQGCKPQKNDILIAKDGSYFYYGFVVKEEMEQAVLSSIAILRPNLQQISPHYLCRYMLSKEVVDLVGRNYVTGAAIKRVILKGIKQIPVMLPPLELQNQFADFVKEVDKSKFVVQKALDEAQLLFDSLMQQYFG